jgi:prepilin-type N-terminal cleavage/methylation domain-containing protein
MLSKLINKKNKGSESGFTIIEVLIVLAIAGLILVVVLIAIPQLQRNQRNSARQNDASRVATSVSNWVANNNGGVPSTAAHLDEISADLGGLSQYTLVTSGAGANFTIATGTQVAVANINNISVVTGARCGTSGASVGGAGTSSRQFVILYATETSAGGTVTGQCLEV